MPRVNAAILLRAWVAGGAETYLLDFGRCLAASGYDVEFLYTQREAPTEALCILGRSDEAALFRRVADDAGVIERETKRYDLFINAAAHFPIVGRARRNWLIVFAPGTGAPTMWRKTRRVMTATVRRTYDHLPQAPALAPVQQRLSIYPPSTERAALCSTDRIIGISQFVADIMHVRHKRPCHVIYPSVTPVGPGPEKGALVVSIGRFAPWGNAKRHDLLVEAARLLAEPRPDIRVALVGSLSHDVASHDYLKSLKLLAGDVPSIEFFVDAQRDVIVDLLGQASAYWHAAGYGLDPCTDPDSVEQFGISVVEAMSACVVPLVVPIAGPAEIVTHDVDGLYWNSPEELASLTGRLDSNELGERLAKAAQIRSQDFSYDRMAASIDRLL